MLLIKRLFKLLFNKPSYPNDKIELYRIMINMYGIRKIRQRAREASNKI